MHTYKSLDQIKTQGIREVYIVIFAFVMVSVISNTLSHLTFPHLRDVDKFSTHSNPYWALKACPKGENWHCFVLFFLHFNLRFGRNQCISNNLKLFQSYFQCLLGERGLKDAELMCWFVCKNATHFPPNVNL